MESRDSLQEKLSVKIYNRADSDKAYYRKNIDIIKVKQKAYRDRNREKLKEINRNYYLKLKSEGRVKKRKAYVYKCISCKKEIVTRASSKSTICRPCLAKRNLLKATKMANYVRTLRPYEATYRSFLRTAIHKVCISYPQFVRFTRVKNCFYCGSKIEWHLKSKPNVNGRGSYLKYNLDRVDPKKPYTVKNCVVCCHTCNKMKSNFSFSFWKSHINRIFITMQMRKDSGFPTGLRIREDL